MSHPATTPALPAPVALRRAASYRVRLADDAASLRAAQALRFAVFNLELREGLAESWATGLDADRFDAVCDHLLVEDATSGQVVGTYRLQTGTSAARRHGYYSEREFDFAPFEPVRAQVIELGRACVHAQHRNFAVLNLLWSGIADYAAARGARWLLGCSSLTAQDPAVGAAAWRRLQPHWVEPRFRTVPTAAFACPLDLAGEPPKVPKLLSAYLALGASICGPPALDREFGTIDFLTLLDLEGLPNRWLARARAG
ncbi:MAG: GNAT family N-acetyltransferase [Piscinibacter sp.]|nr:GNAT family N-acetyltransferase [Piscinibacter sp.]